MVNLDWPVGYPLVKCLIFVLRVFWYLPLAF